MSNTFKLADKFGFSSPLKYQKSNEDLEIYKDKVLLNQKTVKSGIIWVNSSSDFDKKFGLPKQNPNKFRVFIELKQGVKKQQGKYNKLKDAKITINDFKKTHGVSLGKNLVKAVTEEKKNANIIVDDFFNWLSIRKSTDEKTHQELVGFIKRFVEQYPLEAFKPKNGFNELLKLLQECIALGIIGINDIAKFLSEEVFNVLATQIRKLELKENRWNPDSKDDKQNPNYNPLFKDFSEFEKGIETTFKNLISFEVEATKYEQVNSIINLIKKLVIKLFNGLKKRILDPIKDLNQNIRKNNAFIVGFINGIISAVASIVEGLGFIIGLFEYGNLKQFLETIEKLVEDFNWSVITGFIKNEVQQLFAFLTSNNIYTQCYELGKFIPKLIEIVIGIITGYGTAKTIAQVLKNIPKHTKELVKSIKELRNQLVFKLDTKLINQLKKEGVSVKVSFQTPPTLGSGLPKIEIKNKKFEVFYQEYKLKTFKDEAKANEYLKKLDKNREFFTEETNFVRFGFKVFKFSRRFVNHMEYGHIRIKKINPQKAKGRNVVDEYEYIPGNGRVAETGFNYKPIVGGAHILRNLNNDFIKITENIGTFKLSNGNIVRQAKIEFWIEELQQWIPKRHTHTFWPQNWSYQKIESIVLESTKNIISNRSNKFIARTKDGIKIEFYINDVSKEIETAYIVFE